MELESKPNHAIDLQASEICNTVEGTNKKLEPEFYTDDDFVTFSEHIQSSGNDGVRVEVKTEVNDTDEYENMSTIHGSAHCDDGNYINSDYVRDQIYDTNVPVKSEPGDECLETCDNTAFIIEIDTCKDEYYETHVYSSNCVNDTLQQMEREVVDTIQPCCVVLSDIKHTYPGNMLMQSSVQIHDTGPTDAVDEHCEAAFTNINICMQTNNTKVYKCTVCEVTVTNKSQLNRHTLIHTGQKPHKCSVCGFGFAHKGDLKKHKLVHTGEKPHKCYVCGVGFARKHILKSHMSVHTGEKPHKCYVCDASFTRKYNLKRHMRTHTGEKPYTCSVCGAEFTHNKNLEIHTRIHTGEKPHKCSVCEVAFARKYHLTLHMQMHTTEKLHKCPICGVEFAQKGDLKKHMSIHTGEKPHKCSVCGVTFARKYNLKQHMRTHTG